MLQTTEGHTDLSIRETLPAPLDRISIHISPNADPDKIRETLKTLTGGSVDVDRVGKALKFVIGKACLMVKQRKLYRGYGFKSNEAWLKAEVYRPGLSHGTVWKGIRAVKAFPETPAEQLAGIPEQSLTTAAQMILRKRLKGRAAAKLLGEAERMPSDEFADQYGQEALRTGFAVIRVVTTKTFKKEFERIAGEDPEEFLKDLIRKAPARAGSARRLQVA